MKRQFKNFLRILLQKGVPIRYFFPGILKFFKKISSVVHLGTVVSLKLREECSINPFESSVVFHTKTSNLFCSAKQMQNK